MPTNGVNSQFFPSPQMVKASFADSKTSGLPDRPAQRKLVADEVPPVVIHAEEPGSVVARPSKVALTELVDSGDLGKLRTNFSNHLGKLDRRTASAQEKESLAANKRFCSDNEPALRTGIGNFGGRLLALEATQPRDAAGKEIHYLGQLARHVHGTQRFQHVISHDMDIVTSETLSFVMRKLLKHPDDPGHKELAVQVLQAFHENFCDYLKNSHTYAKVLPSGEAPEIAARQAVGAMLAGLSKQSVIPAIQAIRDAVQQILPTSKPPYNPFEPQGQWKNHHSHPFN